MNAKNTASTTFWFYENAVKLPEPIHHDVSGN